MSEDLHAAITRAAAHPDEDLAAGDFVRKLVRWAMAQYEPRRYTRPR